MVTVCSLKSMSCSGGSGGMPQTEIFLTVSCLSGNNFVKLKCNWLLYLIVDCSIRVTDCISILLLIFSCDTPVD